MLHLVHPVMIMEYPTTQKPYPVQKYNDKYVVVYSYKGVGE